MGNGHYELSFLERLSSSQRVLYQRFHYVSGLQNTVEPIYNI